MPRNSVRWRPRALLDLERSSSYLMQQAGVRIAKKFVSTTQAAVLNLLEFPGSGAPQGPRSLRLQGVRMWIVPGFTEYLIYYRATSEGIEILRLLHAARDRRRLLHE